MHHKNHLKEFFILLAIVLILIVFSQIGKAVDIGKIINTLKDHPVEGAIVYVLYSVTSVIIITLPIVPLWPVVLFIYPFWAALLLSLIGQLLGASIDFWLARKFGQNFVTKIMGKKLFNEIDHFINVNNPKTFFLIRLFGNNYFDPISYIAGLSKMSFGKFILITSIASGIWLTGMLYLVNRLGGLDNMKGLLSIMGIYGGFILVGTIIWEMFHRHHKKHYKNK